MKSSKRCCKRGVIQVSPLLAFGRLPDPHARMPVQLVELPQPALGQQVVHEQAALAAKRLALLGQPRVITRLAAVETGERRLRSVRWHSRCAQLGAGQRAHGAPARLKGCSAAPVRLSCKTVLTLHLVFDSERPPPGRPAGLDLQFNLPGRAKHKTRSMIAHVESALPARALVSPDARVKDICQSSETRRKRLRPAEQMHVASAVVTANYVQTKAPNEWRHTPRRRLGFPPFL